MLVHQQPHQFRDDNRGVMSVSNPHQSRVHAEAYELACRTSQHFRPQTHAYYEIFLDGEKVAGEGERDDVEPIYGKTYMPRKFKIGFAVPPSNDIDVFAQDLGFIAILGKSGTIEGWNVSVGGNVKLAGIATLHGGFYTSGSPVANPDSSPFRSADLYGFTGGLDFGFDHFGFSIGAGYQLGTSHQTSITVGNGAQTGITGVRMRALSLLYAISYSF